MPVAAQPVVSATLGKNDSRYQVGMIGGALRAENPAQTLQADFTPQGMEVRSGQVRWRLALAGYGYGDHLEKVGDAVPQSRANRVEYHRGPLVEWYMNGPAGLEQGFTLNAPPVPGTRDTGYGTPNSSTLTFELKIGGDLTATADSPAKGQEGGWPQGLTLRDGNGQAALRYTGLAAHDASGRMLAAWLEVGKKELRLRVNDAGARYPVVVDPFVQQAELTASDGAAGDQFGNAVAISSDGTTIVVGAPDATIGSNTNQGAAYVFVMSSGGWGTTSTFTAKLTASDGVATDQFGNAVAVSSDGSTIVAGAYYAPYNSTLPGPGAAYVFVKPGGGWATTSTFTAKLTASDGAAIDSLGCSVGVSGDGSTVVAGASGAPYNSTTFTPGPGAAYVFVKPGGGWATTSTFTAKLTASDGESGDFFGAGVGVNSGGSTIVAGAIQYDRAGPGAAYVFVMPSSGGWATTSTFTAELTPSDGAAYDELGSSVGISSDGSTIVAGAPTATISSNSGQGAAYVFVLPSSGGWVSSNETAKLTASDGAPGDSLGSSVGISNDGSTIVAGAPDATISSNTGQGAAYVFVLPGSGGWVSANETAKLTASGGASASETAKPATSGGASGASLGTSVCISGDGLSIAAGAIGGNNNQGAGYVFLTAPTVTFTGAPASEPYQGTFSVPNATTNSSTLPVYTSGGSCSNSGGTTTYTMTSGTGACHEIATWPGDVDYASAKVIQRTTASKITPTVTFTGAPPSQAYQGTFTVASTTDSSTSPVYTASGSCTNVGTLYTMTKGTGACTPKVSWVTDANYLRASLTQTTTASKIGQTVSFTTGAPATASYKSTFPVAASSDSGLTVALSVAAGSVCSLGPRTTVSGVTSAKVTMKGGTGTCYIDANQAGNSNYTAATQQQTWAAALKIGQTITFTTPAPSSASVNSTFPVAADSSSGLTVGLSVDAGSTGVCKLGPRTIVSGVTNATVTMLKSTGTCTIDANQAGNGNYSAAAQQQTSAAATP